MPVRLKGHIGDVFTLAQFEPDMSIEQMARRLKLRSSSVRYAIKKLFSDGSLARIPTIDFSALGFNEYILRFSVSFGDSETYTRIKNLLVGNGRVLWAIQMSGDYQYTLCYLARDPCEVERFLSDFGTSTGVVMSDKTLAVKTAMTFFGRRTFGNPHIKTPCRYYLDSLRSTPFDELDHQILRQMMRICDGNTEAIARSLGASSSTIRYRIERLERVQIIKDYRLTVNNPHPNISQLRLFLSTRGVQPQFESKLSDWSVGERLVVWVHRMLGRWDYELVFESENQEALSRAYREVHAHFGLLCSAISSAVLLSVLKSTGYPITKWEDVQGDSILGDEKFRSQG